MLGDRAHNFHQLHKGLVLHTTQQDVDVVAGFGVLCGSRSTALHETIVVKVYTCMDESMEA
jgi:hypothetical protein